MDKSEQKGLSISTKSFLTAIAVIFALMTLAYALTLAVPADEYVRVIDKNGNMVIDTAGGFAYAEGGISFARWLLSPVLVLGASGNGTLIAVIVFLLLFGFAVGY